MNPAGCREDERLTKLVAQSKVSGVGISRMGRLIFENTDTVSMVTQEFAVLVTAKAYTPGPLTVAFKEFCPDAMFPPETVDQR